MPTRPKPARRQVSTWQDAEVLAADWMRYFGYDDAAVTGSGPDGGIDVTSSRAVAQVKFKAAQVGTPELQRLYGARGPKTEQDLLFFTGTSYSTKAVEDAASTDMALFKYSLNGDVTPTNAPARAIVACAVARDGPQPAPAPPKAEHSTASPTATVVSSELAKSSKPPAPPGAIASALLLLFPGLLAVTAGGALFENPDHLAVAAMLAVIGIVFYIPGVVGLVAANRSIRLRSSGAAAVATFFTSAPAVAFWFGLAFGLRSDVEHPAGVGVLLIASVLTVAPVLTIVSSWRTPAGPQPIRPYKP